MPYLRQCRKCGFQCWGKDTMEVHKRDCNKSEGKLK